jgi:phage terminase large subunit-like protein
MASTTTRRATTSTCRRHRPRFLTLRIHLLLFGWLLAAAAPKPRRKKRNLVPGTLDHFEAFCKKFLVLDNGKAFRLEPFQRTILEAYFDGCTETVVLLPKKNGKTTLLAALALYHLIYTPDAACYIAASAYKQAGIMYDQLCGFVERKGTDGRLRPEAATLQKRVLLRKGTKEVRSRRDSGKIQVLSGDKDTGDGVIPTLALIDELHRHKDGGQLYGVMVDGLIARNGQAITISTAGESHKTALGRLRRKAHRMRGLKRVGKYTTVRTRSFCLHEWALDDDDDLDDFKLVKQVNPLSSVTLAKLRDAKRSPAMTPSRWARFRCGVWMHGDDAAVSPLAWRRCGVEGLTLTPGAGIYIGLDIGWVWDTTAVVPIEPYEREKLVIKGRKGWWRYKRVRIGKPTVLIPPRDGTRTPREDVIDAVVAFKEAGFQILGVVFDRNADGEAVATDLERDHGLKVIEHSQDPSPMADASMGLTSAIGEQEVEHPCDDELTDQMLAARTKSVKGERWRFDAPVEKRGQRKHGHQDGDDVEYIDCAIAVAMGRRVATAPQPPKFNHRIEAL